MIGSILVRGRLTQAICLATVALVSACASQVSAQDNFLPLLRPAHQKPVSPLLNPAPAGPIAGRGTGTPLNVTVSLYRDTLTAGDKAIYNEIFGNFADAVFEATEGQHFVNNITVFQNGQPVVDTPPVISISGPNPLSIEVGQVYTEFGATALDVPDGDLSSNIVIFGSVNTAIANDYSVAYVVSDSAGQQTVEFRTVHVVGKDPVIRITGENPVNHVQSTSAAPNPYHDAGATAFDVSDGDLTGTIKIVNTVIAGTVGSYVVTYTVTDSNGNTIVENRKVNVIAATAANPSITILGPPIGGFPNFQDSNNPMTINVGDVFTDANDPATGLGAIASDVQDGFLPVEEESRTGLPANGGIATNAGAFFVRYKTTDSNGNVTREARKVNVIGKHPVITLNGTNPVTVNVGTPYVDAGATAFDVSDGNLTPFILSATNVDTTVPGTYEVQYEVTDSGGHTVDEFRFVNVVQTFDFGQESNIYWLPSGVPSFRLSGGVGTPGGQIAMFDTFEKGDLGANINLLDSALDRRRAGYILASLWMQYTLGVGGEFKDLPSDIAVKDSLLADPFSPALSSDGLGLNLSATLSGVATAGQFYSLQDTHATPQFRLQGASAWATIARTYDPKPARVIAKRPRTFYPELSNNAPIGAAAPVVDLVSLPTGPFFATKYLKGQRSFFHIATENSLPIVKGHRDRAANGCVPGRLIDIPTTAPMTFEFPVDSDLQDLRVELASPCTGDLINLDATLTDPQGRIVTEDAVSNPTIQRIFRSSPSVAGTWRLQLSARSFTAESVKIDVVATSFGLKHRLSASLVNEPSNLATNIVSYPNPFVIQVSDGDGRAIRGATVTGTLALPTGIEIPLTFTDNGVSPDLFANDGSYSVDFRYPQNGLYHLDIAAIDLSGTSAFTYQGTSRAPSLGAAGIAGTPMPADIPVGEPYMRSYFFDFTVQGLLLDDYGNTAPQFASLPLTNSDKPGRMDNPTDIDFFRIQVRSRAAVDTVARITNISGGGTYLLRLFDSTGSTEIARGAIGPSGYPQIRKDLDPGVYFLSVSATGAASGDTYSVSAGPPIPSDLAAIGIAVSAGGGRGGGGGGGGGGGCFIATAAYGTPLQSQINQLRTVRDDRLLTNALGAAFTDAYYRLSPPIAGEVARNAALRDAVRGGIEAVLALLNMGAGVLIALGIAALFAGTSALRRMTRR